MHFPCDLLFSICSLELVLICEGARAPADAPDYNGLFMDFGPVL